MFAEGGENYVSVDRNVTPNRIYWGNEQVFGDAFAGYRTRLPWGKVPVALQLDVKNISNSYLANIGRYNDNYTGIRRVYLNEPRSFRFTTMLEF